MKCDIEKAQRRAIAILKKDRSCAYCEHASFEHCSLCDKNPLKKWTFKPAKYHIEKLMETLLKREIK